MKDELWSRMYCEIFAALALRKINAIDRAKDICDGEWAAIEKDASEIATRAVKSAEPIKDRDTSNDKLETAAKQGEASDQEDR